MTEEGVLSASQLTLSSAACSFASLRVGLFLRIGENRPGRETLQAILRAGLLDEAAFACR